MESEQTRSMYSEEEVQAELRKRISGVLTGMKNVPSNYSTIKTKVNNAIYGLMKDGYLGPAFQTEYDVVIDTPTDEEKQKRILNVSFTCKLSGGML